LWPLKRQAVDCKHWAVQKQDEQRETRGQHVKSPGVFARLSPSCH
jgi:hypothetical protein